MIDLYKPIRELDVELVKAIIQGDPHNTNTRVANIFKRWKQHWSPYLYVYGWTFSSSWSAALHVI